MSTRGREGMGKAEHSGESFLETHFKDASQPTKLHNLQQDT